ncbi:hypothetical protein GRF29_154g438075 [Pseudopithomyces chartarum]|uniref:Uncharacterized protein n=1 Tax=Pseudopithomyces chartarum TaxID=1892770 RepID=A0AAN6LS00_9PLEO|nr:hypothetical protein GRF29_154g438075 [Pseudopithomyces chartarum]
MSSPTYVYIPNLIGGQILRIPVQDCDLDLTTTIPTSSTFPPRDTSPAPSITSSSADSVDEEE